jgi:hypothetical protein
VKRRAAVSLGDLVVAFEDGPEKAAHIRFIIDQEDSALAGSR